MGRKAKNRRRSHGSAWLWAQTNAWYYTLPGTKKRVPLYDEQGAELSVTTFCTFPREFSPLESSGHRRKKLKSTIVGSPREPGQNAGFKLAVSIALATAI